MGGSESRVTVAETRRVFEESDPGTPLTVDEIAAALDCPDRSAERNLTELATRGERETKRVGGDQRIWWQAASPDSTLGDATHRDGDGTDRWDEAVERVTDAFYALDDEWRFTHPNEQAEEMLQRSEAELFGERIWDEFPEAADGVVREKYHEAMESQSSVDFDRYYEPLDVWAEINAYPSETGLSVYFVEISERVETERELSRYRRIIETANDGVYAVDPEGNFTMVNEAYAEMLGYDREELLGESVSRVVDDDVAARAREIEREQVAGEREAPTLEAELRPPTATPSSPKRPSPYCRSKTAGTSASASSAT